MRFTKLTGKELRVLTVPGSLRGCGPTSSHRPTPFRIPMKLSTQRNRLDAPRTMRRLPPLYGAVGFQNRALVVQLVS